MKLTSMCDFVLEQQNKEPKAKNFAWFQEISDYKKSSYDSIINYANFLKQPLELWMFVTCDENGNVLEEKSIFNTTDEDYIFDSESFDKYQQAKERCLFDGFEKGFRMSEQKVFSVDNRIFDENETIENLLQYKGIEFTLTKTAIKQFE